jgi:hypothetical protein
MDPITPELRVLNQVGNISGREDVDALLVD